jgi:hypothetical protein
MVDIDPRSGKFKLSRKVLMPKPERPATTNEEKAS